jgi:4-alpha-glucanotransferase
MREDNYSWWKRRLEVACQFYDIYRIDHIIGFFRIWAIPRGESPRKGKFVPPTDDLVVMQGKTLLEMMMNSSKMFPIGEDLGIMPDSIYNALRELGICGTKIIRWEKDRATHCIFTPYKEYYPLSMTSVSTHDSDTLQLWWKKYPEEAKAFSHFKGWHYTPELSMERHKEILWDSHHTASIFHINLLQEYFALFPKLAWPSQEDERINIPGYILPTNWTYRFRPWLEEITSHEPLKKLLQELIH